MLHYNAENMVQQEFPFPAPIMDYIFKNVTAPQLAKLYQTCKFFYDKFRLNIIEDFEIRHHRYAERILGNSLAICFENPAFAKLRNLWISNSISFIDCFRKHDELDVGMFSRLTYDKLNIYGPFPLREYKFLVKPPTLRHLFVKGRIYRSTKTDCLSVEEIFERVPHVSKIDFSLSLVGIGMTPPLDMFKLISMERQTKLTSLHLRTFYELPDSLQVVKFLMKHGTPDIDYYFDFSIDNANDDIKAFYKTIDSELQAWKHSLAILPTISSFINLTGKTAVITGAAEGIGRATVILFRQLGASVIAIARNRFQLKSLVDECQNISTAGFLHTFYRYRTDILFERIDYKFGTKFDILVNNVDTSGWYSIPDIAYEHKYSRDLYIILKCHYDLIKETAPYLKKAKGCIINVSESNGLITRPEEAASIDYGKDRIKNVETELLSSGVRINTVNPGALSTALPRPDGMNDAAYKKYLQESKKTREEQAAKAIAFLASDAAKLIVGSTFPQL